jgi:hypothetical protein
MVKAKKSKKTDSSKTNGAKPVRMATNNSDNPKRCVSLDYHSPALLWQYYDFLNFDKIKKL